MGQVSSRLSGIFNDNAKPKATNKEFQSKNISIFNREVKHFDINDSETLHNGSDTSTLKPLSSFATPRLPLKRTREISPVTAELPQSILDLISSCSKKLRMDEEYLNFPFLDDCKTSEYLKKCKIMYIMRGIPGSGKSTITKHLRRKYSSLEICSADDFFMVDTEYQYDPKKIGEAHKYCKQKAVDAAVSETMTIIVDNTHTKIWEMKFYLSLAKSFNYIPIIVEPKTPWKNDVKELVEKNSHSLDEKAIIIKIKNYEVLNPLYYGWFINEKDSYLLSVEAQSWIEEAFTFNFFLKDLSSFSGARNLNDFLKAYRLPGNSSLFHVTSKYTAKKGKSPEVAGYVDNVEVRNAIGKVFDLEIVGFVITPRTFGARVKLSAEQEILWGGDDDESVPSEFWNVCPRDSSFINEDLPNPSYDIEAHELSLNGENADEIQVANQIENCEIFKDTGCIESDGNAISNIALIRKQSERRDESKCAGVNIKIISETNNECASNIRALNGNENCIFDEITDITENSDSLLDSISDNSSSNILDVEQTEQPLKNDNQDGDQDAIEDVSPDVNDSAHLSENSIVTELKESKKISLFKNKVSPIEVQSDHENAELATPPKKPRDVPLFSPKQNKSPNKNKSTNKKKSNNRSPDSNDVLIPENGVNPEHSKVGATIKEVHKSTDNTFHLTSGRGRRAHVTLGCKTDVKPVTTGLDLLFAVELEAQAREEVNEKELSKLNVSLEVIDAQDPQDSLMVSKSDFILPNKTLQHRPTLLLNGATATNYGNGVWVIYLDKALVVSSVFNLQC